jgi:hypothetical protein
MRGNCFRIQKLLTTVRMQAGEPDSLVRRVSPVGQRKSIPNNRLIQTGTNGYILPSSPIVACLHQNPISEVHPPLPGRHRAELSLWLGSPLMKEERQRSLARA